MTDLHDRSQCAGRCLRDILLDYLKAEGALPWPGADGLTVEEVLAGYAVAAALGRVPDQEELRLRYPELDPEIRSFFAGGAGDPLSRRCRQ
jgi:hypothetical protein